jgi:hypothetical protein
MSDRLRSVKGSKESVCNQKKVTLLSVRADPTRIWLILWFNNTSRVYKDLVHVLNINGRG